MTLLLLPEPAKAMLRLNLANPAENQKQPVLITITSPHGSTGKSTVAVNLAAELAKSPAKVLLIDFDYLGPSIAATLGLQDSAPGLLAASRLALQSRLTGEELDRLAIHIPGFGISVLPSQSTQSRWAELTASAAGEIVRVAKESYEYVVVDATSPTRSAASESPPHSEITRDLIRISNQVLVVALADPVGIYRLLQVEPELLELNSNLKLVINRLRNSVVPQARKEVTETIQRLSKLELATLLPDDQSAIDQSVREAIPLALLAKSSSFRQTLAAFARKEILGLRSPLDARLAKLG